MRKSAHEMAMEAAFGDGGPIEGQARERVALELSPGAQALQPLFQPAMIPRDNQKADDECREQCVAGLKPLQAKRRDAAERTEQKDRHPPAREQCRRPLAVVDAPADPPDQSREELFFRQRRAHERDNTD